MRAIFSRFWLISFISSWLAGAAQLPDGAGKATMQKICSGCHAPEIVIGRHETRDSWEQIVSSMVDKGANGTDDEFNTIIDYLAAHFGTESNQKTPRKPRRNNEAQAALDHSSRFQSRLSQSAPIQQQNSAKSLYEAVFWFVAAASGAAG